MLKQWRTYLICLTFFALTGESQAQPGQDSVKSIVTVDGHYGLGLPFGDLKDRFAEHFTLGTTVSILTKGDLYAAINYDFIFGSQTREDVLSNLKTIDGGIIGRDMQFASVFLRERGHHFSLEGGYFFRSSSQRAISGIFVVAGLGYLRHKIRIVDDFDSVVQILDPYHKGYDRLTGGWSLEQKVGYQYFGRDKLVNFRISLAVTEAFTRDLRNFNYNTTEVKSSRLDILTGIQVAWIIPIYLTREIRYY
ncbi:MAG: hypothetical protein KDC80_30710 [Saprospiraceae bacterium]|nr:hypothetical protein [Saprospiraceae bacterium]